MKKYCQVSKCRFPIYHVTSYHQCGTCKQYGHGMIECHNTTKINYLNQFQYDQLPETEHCLFGICHNPSTHTTESHTCTKCSERFHSSSTCPTNPKLIKEHNIVCPNCRTTNKTIFKTFGSENKCVVCYDTAQIFLPECGHECLCIDCSKKIDSNKTFDDYYDEKYLKDHNYDIPLIKSHLKKYPSYVAVYQGLGHCTIVRRLNETSELEGMFMHSDDGYDPIKTQINKDFIDGYCKIDCTIIYD